MAVTYTPNEAFNYANYMTKEMNLSRVQYQILDEACSRLWNAAAWPWTIGYLDTITVAADTIDYAVTGNFPSDFGRLYLAQLFNSDKILKPLAIVPLLPATPGRVGQPISIAPIVADNEVRIYPKPPSTMPSDTQKILLYYKKNPPKITSANAGTACLVMDDRWVHVYKSGVLINAYKYADDARGYDITRDDRGSTKLGGELANFEYLIGEMKKSEEFTYEWDVYADAKGDTR